MTRRWPRRILGWTAGALLLVGASVAIWWLYPETVPPVPEPDLRGLDPAVAAAIERARQGPLDAPRAADAWGRYGIVLGAHGLVEEAAVCLGAASRLDRREPGWPYLMGLLLAGRDADRAIGHLQAAVVRAGKPSEAMRLRLAKLLLTTGSPHAAQALYEEINPSGGCGPWARLGLARVALELDDWEQAREHLEQLKADREMAKASRLLLAEVARRRGDAAAAARWAAEADALPDDPEPPDPWHDRLERAQVGEQASLRRADQLLARDQIAPALALLADAARDYPRSAAVWQSLGRALLRARRLADAENAFRRAHEIDPHRAEVLFYLGVVAHEQGDRARAAAEFERATRDRPDHAMAWFNLGQCRRESGDKEGAVAAFRRAVEYKPHLAAAHLALARLLHGMKRPDEARRHLDLAERLAPDDAEVSGLRRELRVGK